MSSWNWTPFLVGGGLRPDAMSGLTPQFSSSLAQMFQAAPPEIQDQLRITSAYRSPEVQAGLYEDALAKYGSPEAARKWVAPPGNSRHNHGGAVDLKYLGDAAREWAHQNAGQFGLSFPMDHEPWHIEPLGEGGARPPLSFGPGMSVPEGPGGGLAAMFNDPAYFGAAEMPAPPAMGAPRQPQRQETPAADQVRRIALADLIRF